MEDGWGRSVWWWMEVNKVRGKRRRGDGAEGGLTLPGSFLTSGRREASHLPSREAHLLGVMEASRQGAALGNTVQAS